MAKTKINLIYADECYRIMGLIFKIYNDIGFGHKESFYQKAIAETFRRNNIEFKEQLKVKLIYKGKNLGVYILDFLVFNKIILELKQKDYFSSKDILQLFRYLKTTGLKLGILIHFTSRGIRYKRILNIKNNV